MAELPGFSRHCLFPASTDATMMHPEGTFEYTPYEYAEFIVADFIRARTDQEKLQAVDFAITFFKDERVYTYETYSLVTSLSFSTESMRRF